MVHTIHKGTHRSRFLPSLTLKNRIKIRFRFDKTAIYNFDNMDYYDINKLYGLSNSWSYHRNDSARIGWRWDKINKQIQLFLYVYNNSTVTATPITRINLNEYYIGEIIIEKDRYRAIVHDKFNIHNVYIPRTSNKNIKGLKYKLFPYFGGNNTAKNKINIEITNIKKL